MSVALGTAAMEGGDRGQVSPSMRTSSQVALAAYTIPLPAAPCLLDLLMHTSMHLSIRKSPHVPASMSTHMPYIFFYPATNSSSSVSSETTHDFWGDFGCALIQSIQNSSGGIRGRPRPTHGADALRLHHGCRGECLSLYPSVHRPVLAFGPSTGHVSVFLLPSYQCLHVHHSHHQAYTS